MTTEIITGLTGEVGQDGILNPEQYSLLNSIQQSTAAESMEYLNLMQEGDKYPLIAMATGFGKGKIIHEAIKLQKILKPESRILLIAGTKLELVKQSQNVLNNYLESESLYIPSVIDNDEFYSELEESSDAKESDNIADELIVEEDERFEGYKVGKLGEEESDVQVTTIQTIQTRNKKRQLDTNYDLVIVDEVHNIGTPKGYDAIKKFSRIVGFTATPYRHSGKMKEPSEYGFEIIRSLPLPDAQEMRFLPPLFGLQINTAEIVDEIPTTRNGKIDYGRLERILKESDELRPYIAEKIAPLITLNNNRYKTVMAVNFVWEAQEMAQLLKEKGIKVGLAVNKRAAKELHSEEIPAIDAIERYKLPHEDENGIQVLISPYVAGEGFDAPQTEFMVWASPTDSPLRYTQYTGRLARRAPGKAYGVVIDCLYQTSQYNWSFNFGMWMKGHVQQLKDGRLYLGPIQDIKDLSAIQAMQKMTDSMNLEDIQRENSNYIQFSIPDLIQEFRASQTTIHTYIRNIKEQNPGSFVRLTDAGRPYFATPEGIAELRKLLSDTYGSEGFRRIPLLELAQNYSLSEGSINTYIKNLQQTYPQYFKGGGKGQKYHFNDEGEKILIELIQGRRINIEGNLPEGFIEIGFAQIAEKYNLEIHVVEYQAKKLRDKFPETFTIFNGQLFTTEVMRMELIKLLDSRVVGENFSPVDYSSLEGELSVSSKLIRKVLKDIVNDHPDDIKKLTKTTPYLITSQGLWILKEAIEARRSKKIN